LFSYVLFWCVACVSFFSVFNCGVCLTTSLNKIEVIFFIQLFRCRVGEHPNRWRVESSRASGMGCKNSSPVSTWKWDPSRALLSQQGEKGS
jgi:hypothetical protein